MNRLSKIAAVGTITLGGVVVGVGAEAGASPARAPSASVGTFSCTTGRSGTFVHNTGRSTATPWGVAHLAFTTGTTGVLAPSELYLTFYAFDVTATTAPVGAFPTTQVKGNGHVPTSSRCHIFATFGEQYTPTLGATFRGYLTGTVVGNIVGTVQ